MSKGKRFRLTGLEVVEGTICDQPMNPEAKVVLFKRHPAQQEDEMSKQKKQKNAPGDQDHSKALEGLSDEQKEAILAMVEEEKRKALEEEEAKRKAADGDEEEEEEAEKAADPVDDEQVGKAVAKAIAKATADLQKQLAEERSLREEREYLEKARAFPAIPVPAEKIGGLMRAVATLEKSHGDTLGQVLRACNELAASNTVITKSLGAANGLDGGGGSVSDEIESIASKAMAANPDLTRSKAIAKAWKDNPQLLKRYREETTAKR